jgi:hypothetical protein
MLLYILPKRDIDEVWYFISIHTVFTSYANTTIVRSGCDSTVQQAQ